MYTWIQSLSWCGVCRMSPTTLCELCGTNVKYYTSCAHSPAISEIPGLVGIGFRRSWWQEPSPARVPRPVAQPPRQSAWAGRFTRQSAHPARLQLTPPGESFMAMALCDCAIDALAPGGEVHAEVYRQHVACFEKCLHATRRSSYCCCRAGRRDLQRLCVCV